MTPPEARYQFGPLERRGVIAGLSGGQVLSLAVALVVAVVVVRARPDALGLAIGVPALALGAAAAFVPLAGRTVEEWAPVLAGWVVSGLSGGRRWVTAGPARGGGAPPPPPALAGCELLEHVPPAGGRRMGVVHDRSNGTYAAVVSVAGGGFALVDGQDKERRLAAWAAVLAGLAREGTVVHRLQWIERARPGDHDGIQLAMAERLVPDAPPEAAESYAHLVAGAGPVTADHETLLVVAVCPARARRQVRSAGGGRLGALTLLGRELSLLESNLHGADVDSGGPLGYGALAAALARGFHGGAATWLTPWPVATEASWSAVRTDDRWHAVYWVAEWPRSEVGPDFLVPLLLLAGGVRAVSVTMEPVSPRRAARQVEAARTAGAADDELRRRGGFLATARRAREARGMAQREAELADGHAEYRFSGYVTVTGGGPEELEAACSEVEQAAGQARLELRRLYGQQDRALTFTLPLARGLA